MTFEDTVEVPFMRVQFYLKNKSEDMFEDPLMSVPFYIKRKVFSFRVTVHLLFSFLLQ